MSAFTAGWLDRGMEAIAGFLPSPLRAVFPVNLHHVRRKLTLLIQLLKNNETKNNGNCWFERLTIGGHRRLSANRMKRRPSPALCRSSHLSMLFYIKFWDLSSRFFGGSCLLPLPCVFMIHQGRKFVKAFFLGSFIRFLQLTALLYIKGKVLSSTGFWFAEIAGCYCCCGRNRP